ncbi:CONSTANS-like zinc finger protein [Striga asiatica]|uniref:CONSTANS-like zinc finger protein n=1 Tax=Striga asiatica TaxID=4170 RepID=A0A5A7NW96_STRAF|nr:CONSTANS-like zinc finger protein [Striga asiatica]
MSAPDQENHVSGEKTNQLCDFCEESLALLYCRADSAKLCFSCDLEVHSTNPLFRKHVRSLLCNSCSSSPSSIFCCTESAVLCQNCDWETHRVSGSIHDRRPVEGFSGCPSVSELLGFLGLEDLGKKGLGLGGCGRDEDLLDFLVWETPSIVSLDDLVVAGDCVDGGRSFQALGVPPLPKNRNAACGKDKEEVFRQLREMAKNDPYFTGSLEDLKLHVGIQSQLPGKCQLSDSIPPFRNKTEPISASSYEANVPNWTDFASGVLDESFDPTVLNGFDEMNHLVPDEDLNNIEDKCVADEVLEMQWHNPLDSKTPQMLHAVGARELNTQERDSAISRYKEKKKTRRY